MLSKLKQKMVELLFPCDEVHKNLHAALKTAAERVQRACANAGGICVIAPYDGQTERRKS